MSFLSSMQKTAKKLIDKFGSNVALLEEVQVGYDISTGKYTTIEFRHDTMAYISQFDNALIVSGVVNMNDLKLLCYNFNNVLPDKSWKVEIDGKKLNIISIQNVDTTQNGFITYTIQARS